MADPANRPPLRMAFLYVPNGVHMPAWTPRSAGPEFELPAILEPLSVGQGRPARALAD